jgi:DNA-binding MarR family transcriptional regulator
MVGMAAAGMSEDDWGLWRAFGAMNRALARELDRQLQRDAGISSADYAILITLFEAPERRLRTGELAELLTWEKSRVSHQIARMEARGLVERNDCAEDARGTWITLTADGRRATLGAMRDHAAKLREIFFDVLGDREKEALRASATRVLDKINPSVCTLLPDEPTEGTREIAAEVARA